MSDLFHEKETLVEALLACPSFKSRQSRDKIVDALSFDQHIARADTNFDDSMNIVTAILNYPNGIEELLEKVRAYEGDSYPRQQLDATVAQLKPLLVCRLDSTKTETKHQRTSINRVLQGAMPQQKLEPYKWRMPWSTDINEMYITEGSLKNHLDFNPFAAKAPENDSLLHTCYIQLSTTEELSNPDMSILCCGEGYGKTTAALNLYNQCITPKTNPTIHKTFPIYWNITSVSDVNNGQISIIRLLTNQISESLVKFLSLNPGVFLASVPIQRQAMKTLLLNRYNPFNVLVDRLRPAGLEESELRTIFIETLEDTEIVNGVECDNLKIWLEHLANNFLPIDFEAFYLLIDISDQTLNKNERIALANLISSIVRNSPDLMLHKIYPKLFIPDTTRQFLQLPSHITPTRMKWCRPQLKQVLYNRLNQAGYISGDLNALFDVDIEIVNVDNAVLDASQNSPRRLFFLMDLLIQYTIEHKGIAPQTIQDILAQN